MSELAKQILKKAKEEKATFVDLGNCGLDFLPNELFDKFFTKTLKGLSLGLFYFNEMNNLVGSENSDRVNYLNEHELGKLSKLENLQRFFFNVSQNSDNRISSMSFVSGLMRLNYLSLTGNKIYKIEGLDENLQTLDISNNQISKIEGLNENLQTLDISNNQISKIEGLNENLQILNLSSNQISKIEGLNEKLQTLNLYGNQISKIDGLNKNLKSLNLYGNRIRKIEGLNKKLQTLNLYGNQIYKIEELNENLQTLNLYGNQISKIEGLNENLQTLNLYGNQIDKIEGLNENLQTLDLGRNRISKIEGLNENLHTLNLSYNRIFKIEGLNENLKSLNLYGNQISKIEGLNKNLHTLNLSVNQIKEIEGLNENLQILNLSYNQINNIKGLNENLQILDLRENKIDSLEPILPFIRRKNNPLQLNVLGNPLITHPMEIVMQGNEAIINYSKDLRTGVDHLFEAKLLLVGEERAGKSTIAEALKNPEFKINPYRESTHGMDITQWIISKEKAQTEKDFRFNIWDFGGQEIYHSTHQFFLTKRSLYLFVTEARKDLRYDDFYYWLNVINTLAGDSPVILIQNKTDQDHKSQNIDEYRRLFPNIAFDLMSISCDTSHEDWNSIYSKKLDLLKENIYKLIKEKKIEGIGDELPKAWVEIREEISKLKNKNVNQITRSDYINICKEKGLDVKTALSLSEYFHALGVFLHFPDDIQLMNTIFLNSEWVTKAIYKVFDNKKIKDAHGKFTDRDLKEIWEDEEFNGMESELLNLLKNPKFKICYQHENSYYLIPQLFDNKPLKYEWRTNENNLNFRYDYGFMPKGILSQLIVVMHKYIFNDTYWLNGVLFDYRNSRAIVIEDRFQKKNIISIKVEGDEKKELLSIIKSNIETINESYKNLIISEEFGCNCSECLKSDDPYFFPKKKVDLAIEKRKNTVQCDKSLDEVEIGSLLDKYVKLDESVAQKMKLVDSKPQIARNDKKIFLCSSNELENDRKDFEILISEENNKLKKDNIYLEIIKWDNFDDSISKTRLQDEYNKKIPECDIFVMLIHNKVGMYSAEEFEKAFGEFQKGKKMKIYTFFKKPFTIENRKDNNSVWDFEEKLIKLGHFKTNYESTKDLLFQFLKQLNRYIIPGYLEE